MSGSKQMTIPLGLSGSFRPFLYSSFCAFFQLFLISLCSVRSLPLLYFTHLCMKCSLGISNFLDEFSRFPILLFSLFVCIVHLRRFSRLSLLFWNKKIYHFDISFPFLLPFASLLSSAICKACLEKLFAFFCFFFFGMALVIASCTTKLCP